MVMWVGLLVHDGDVCLLQLRMSPRSKIRRRFIGSCAICGVAFSNLLRRKVILHGLVTVVILLSPTAINLLSPPSIAVIHVVTTFVGDVA